MQLLVFALTFILSTGAVSDSSPMIQYRNLQNKERGIQYYKTDYTCLHNRAKHTCYYCSCMILILGIHMIIKSDLGHLSLSLSAPLLTYIDGTS